jgi:hypothetical protein
MKMIWFDFLGSDGCSPIRVLALFIHNRPIELPSEFLGIDNVEEKVCNMNKGESI